MQLKDGTFADLNLSAFWVMALRKAAHEFENEFEAIYDYATGEGPKPYVDNRFVSMGGENEEEFLNVLRCSAKMTPEGVVFTSPYSDDIDTQRKVSAFESGSVGKAMKFADDVWDIDSEGRSGQGR